MGTSLILYTIFHNSSWKWAVPTLMEHHNSIRPKKSFFLSFSLSSGKEVKEKAWGILEREREVLFSFLWMWMCKLYVYKKVHMNIFFCILGYCYKNILLPCHAFKYMKMDDSEFFVVICHDFILLFVCSLKENDILRELFAF